MKTANLLQILIDEKITIATAESCTGGMIASHIVDVSGASAIFSQGYVTYADDAKVAMLGVNSETIATYGVVSHPVAQEMAACVRRIADTDVGISTTGVAGPFGGTEENPVGTVYIACSIGTKTITRRFHFHGSRSMIRKAATKAAFQLLEDCLKKASIVP